MKIRELAIDSLHSIAEIKNTMRRLDKCEAVTLTHDLICASLLPAIFLFEVELNEDEETALQAVKTALGPLSVRRNIFFLNTTGEG